MNGKGMIKMEVKELGKTNGYVYDISLDGTVVNAYGMNVLSNTDGFNFKKPDSHRYTNEHPYISNGKGRNSENGKAYTRVDADVAEFEDTYMHSAFNGGINKNGLGIDEYCDATINFSRKNYADLLENGKIKLVGNTIKSKKMPLYIEKFINNAIDLLLKGKGKEFLESYYDYIEKIYNLRIPLKEIASVGKIKTSIDTYKDSCNQLTASGNKKARQAWYELAIKENLSVNMGDAIYYINTGTKKSASDVQRITKYYVMDGDNKVDCTKMMEKEYDKWKKKKENRIYVGVKTERPKLKIGEYLMTYHPEVLNEDEIIFNCVMLSNEIVDDEEEHFCSDNIEYNVAKYIEQFNKRVKPLLVCFSSEVRGYTNEKGKYIDSILISNPKDRREFTDEESKLVSGQPYAAKDQDTYEQMMSMEDKEIRFWLSVNRTPPYAAECGMEWDNVVKEYNERQERLKKEGISDDVKKYNEIIDSLTVDDYENFIEEGILPERLLSLVDEDMNSNNFISKKWNIPIGSIFDIIEKDFSIEKMED